MAILTWEHLLKFLFETVTDVAFVPSLAVVAQRGRHFELFVGFFQFITSLCYNLTDALDINLFLSARQWHELTNILTITYGIHLCIFLMGNRHETHDNFLRYIAFASVWIAQVKDRFWMTETRYTAYVAGLFTLMLIGKVVFDQRPIPFQHGKVFRGTLALFVAAVFFYLSLDDLHDPYRLFHGLAQVMVGLALWYLWQAIPENNYKKTDTFSFARVLA